MKALFEKKLLGSRIHGDNTRRSEQILGYFLGPCLMGVVYGSIASTYLMQFYTDVLGIGGILLTWMPFLSKILSGFIGLVIGRLIDRTRTSQGKARPWIFVSGFLIAVCGFGLYAVPRASTGIQIAWVVVSYNLFFSLAYSTYSLSHALMVPLSTRNTKERDSLSMISTMATSLLPGAVATVGMPILITKIGVGDTSRMSWITVMGLLSVLAVPAALIEYYFTKERVTQTAVRQKNTSLRDQIRACFCNRNWILIAVFTLTVHICNSLSSSVMLYYCNWVLGNSIESGVQKQILVNVVGQAPLGFGIVLLWPLVRKFGKRPVTVVGFLIAAVGSFLVLLAGDHMPSVLLGLLIKSFGSLPTYVMASFLAEVMDEIEQKNGFRVDGFSASVTSFIQTVALGLCQSLLLAGINAFGYISPQTAQQVIVQPEPVLLFFKGLYAVMPLIGYAVCAVLIFFYKRRKM